MAIVEEKMRSADVLVFAAPVYFYTIPAQIKALIDRMVPFYENLIEKDVYIIVCAADPEDSMLDLSVEAFRGLTRDCMHECRERGVIKATGVWEKGDVRNTDFMEQAYDMGRSI